MRNVRPLFNIKELKANNPIAYKPVKWFAVLINWLVSLWWERWPYIPLVTFPIGFCYWLIQLLQNALLFNTISHILLFEVKFTWIPYFLLLLINLKKNITKFFFSYTLVHRLNYQLSDCCWHFNWWPSLQSFLVS